MLADDYEGKVQVVDNRENFRNTASVGVRCNRTCRRGQDGGLQIEEIFKANKFESSIYIMLDITLKYLKKGGRDHTSSDNISMHSV